MVPLLDSAAHAASAVVGLGSQLIDRLWPDPTEKAKAKLALAQLAQQGEFKELEMRLAVVMEEARSKDPWTSRARPSFFYVMYIYILAALPFGVCYAFRPDMAQAAAEGVKAWLAAVPDELWLVFGTYAVGFGFFRMKEKIAGVAK